MTDAAQKPRWDPMVKLTHWSIVLAVLANAVLTKEGSAQHVWVGYALGAVLCLRLLWGLVGPEEARFSAFPPSPSRALRHLRDIASGRPAEHRSHNPLGALMVYAIWGTLAVVMASGMAMAGLPRTGPAERTVVQETAQTSEREEHSAKEHEADEDGDREEGGEEMAEEVHEASVNLLYALILLHLGGVMFESRRQKRNLALAMLPGRR